MPKTHIRFVCPQCGSFNSMVEEIVHDEPVSKGATANMRGFAR
jgi:hypothetical protein